MLATLLKEAAEIQSAQGEQDAGRELYLKGLHLLLDVLARHDVDDCPDLVPQVEAYVLALRGTPLPVATLALLMQHYERNGEFGKAEDALFGLLETTANSSAALDLGFAFYQRLSALSDDQLITGGLPRAELEQGIDDLRRLRPPIEHSLQGS
jgi:hypothetical protein